MKSSLRRLLAAATLSLIVLPLLATSPAPAQTPGPTSPDGLWTFFEGVTLPAGYPAPRKYAIARLATTEMAAVLATAPPENPSAPGVPAGLFLPLPDGSFREVGARSSMLMERSLASMDAFHEIATYRFDALHGVSLGGHILTTPAMFTAIGYTGGDLLRIEPIETDDGPFHIIYMEQDRTDGLNDFVHVTDETGTPEDTPILERDFPALDPDFVPPAPPVPLTAPAPNQSLLNESLGPVVASVAPVDGTLRVFRLAATTTGEFYQANDNGGGDFDVVVSLLLRLIAADAVFETQLGVRLTLAASTLNVLFDDPNTDPFNPAATPCQFRDVQPWIALFFLPVASYDLGFLFATGGGGGCAWYVVCNNAFFEKARGAGKFGSGTGLGTGLLLHEIGHQLGARHTFSGSDCSVPNFDGDNANVPSAYEPGSGSTIMSYLGSCGPDDNVDVSLVGAGVYYNVKSIEQVASELTGGVGASCGATLDFGNSPPDVDAGPDYTIPRNTPFTLDVADVSDPDGDPVSVTWEQVDLTAVQRDINTDWGDNPIIRSVPPSGFTDRTIPDIRDILVNQATGFFRPGEVLPYQDRDVTFRVSARDDQLAGGGVAYDEMVVTAQGLPFFVTQPNTAATWHAGCYEDVQWFQGGSTDHVGPDTDFVDILWSDTGGLEPGPDPVRQSFPTTIVAGTPNDSLYQMSVPCAATNAGRLKVMASDNIFFDVNNQNLTVLAQAPNVALPAVAPGVVDDQCEFTVEFSATVTDDCGVAQGDVAVAVAQTSFNYSLGTPSISIVQNGAQQVDVSGSVLVSDLTSSPATLRITVSASDNCAFPSSEFVDVSVSDETPPEIEVAVAPSELWPPNHQLEPITAEVTATDNCSNVSVVLDAIVSDEPDNGTGIGDGNTTDDIQNAAFGTEDLMFDLRRERGQTQDGRTYTITYEATDGSGNTASDDATVHVAHDQH